VYRYYVRLQLWFVVVSFSWCILYDRTIRYGTHDQAKLAIGAGITALEAENAVVQGCGPGAVGAIDHSYHSDRLEASSIGLHPYRLTPHTKATFARHGTRPQHTAVWPCLSGAIDSLVCPSRLQITFE
jgi:hypothetical protein